MDAQTTNRVQVAAHHWRPRFTANGIDVNDFDETVARTTEWAEWGPNWRATGAVHEALGREAEEHGRTVSATVLKLVTRPTDVDEAELLYRKALEEDAARVAEARKSG